MFGNPIIVWDDASRKNIFSLMSIRIKDLFMTENKWIFKISLRTSPAFWETAVQSLRYLLSLGADPDHCGSSNETLKCSKHGGRVCVLSLRVPVHNSRAAEPDGVLHFLWRLSRRSGRWCCSWGRDFPRYPETPDPSDPYFLGPSGSGSVSQRCGFGSFYHRA